MKLTNAKISERIRLARAHCSHSLLSTRRFSIVTRLTSAALNERTSERSSARFPAATTQVPSGSLCSPKRRSSNRE